MAIPTRMQNDWNEYFHSTAAGNTRPWAGGTLSRTSNGADYTYGGQNYAVDASTNLDWLARQSPDLAREWSTNYGYALPQVNQGVLSSGMYGVASEWERANPLLASGHGTYTDAQRKAAGDSMAQLNLNPTADQQRMSTLLSSPPSANHMWDGASSSWVPRPTPVVPAVNATSGSNMSLTLGDAAGTGGTETPNTNPDGTPAAAPAPQNNLQKVLSILGTPVPSGSTSATPQAAAPPLPAGTGNAAPAFLTPDGRLNLEAIANAGHGRIGDTVSGTGGHYGDFNLHPIFEDDGGGTMDGSGGEGGSPRNNLRIVGWRTVAPKEGDSTRTGSKRSEWNGREYTEWDAEGNPVRTGTYSGLTDSPSLMKEAITYAVILAAAAALGPVMGGSGTGGVTGLSEAGLAGEGAFGATNSMGGAGAFGPHGTAYYSGAGTSLGAGSGSFGSGIGPDFTTGFTDGGTSLGSLDTAYTSATHGIPYTGSPLPAGPIPAGPGSNTNPVFNPAQDSQIANQNFANSGGNPHEWYDPTAPHGVTQSPTMNVPPGHTPPSSSTPPGGSPPPAAAPPTSGTPSVTDLLKTIGTIGAGLYGSHSQSQTAKEQREWLDKQMSDIDKLYAPGSPEFNYLMQEMERKDAAAGRNSQYGPRSVDIAARIAEIKAKYKAQIAMGSSGAIMSAIQSGNSSLDPLIAALSQLYSSGSGGITNLSSLTGS